MPGGLSHDDFDRLLLETMVDLGREAESSSQELRQALEIVGVKATVNEVGAACGRLEGYGWANYREMQDGRAWRLTRLGYGQVKVCIIQGSELDTRTGEFEYKPCVPKNGKVYRNYPYLRYDVILE